MAESARTASSLRDASELALAALTALPDTLVVVFDEALRCVLSAGQASRSHGFTSKSAEGQPLGDVVSAALYEQLEPRCRAALKGDHSTFDHEAPHDGCITTVRVAPITEGSVAGGLIVSRDVTEPRQTRAALARSEREYRELAERSSDVVSRTDEHAIYRYVSPSSARVYGFTPEQMVGRAVRDFVHPDDHAGHIRLREALTSGEGEQLGALRHAHADGSWVWVELRYGALRDDAGRFVGVQTAARDITDRMAAEAARAVADEQFRTAFDGAPIGVALVAPDGRLVRVNDAMCEIVGYSSGELLSRRFQEVTHPDDVDADVANVQAVLDGRTASYQMEKRYVRADGTDVWTLLAVSLVRDGAGQPLHFVAQIQDISQRRHLEAELRRLADRDDLTGLYNRRFFTRQLAHQLRRTRRYGEDAAVLLVDLDGFKRVNDTLGHHAGDELLRHVARVLNTRLRESDIVARLGGDEFAVLLPLATAERAHQAAELLERELRKSPIEVEGAVLTAGASIGVAKLTPDLEAEDALRLADRAMYAVKRGRRAAAASRPDAS